MGAIFPQIAKNIYISVEKRLKFVFGNREYREADRATLLPTWVGGRFRPVRLRLIAGEAELLLGMRIIRNLCITRDLRNRYFHIGKGEWQVVTYSRWNRWVFPRSPTARGDTIMWGIFCENGKMRIRSFSGAGGFRGKLRKSGKFRPRCMEEGGNRTDRIESDVADLKYTPWIYLSK